MIRLPVRVALVLPPLTQLNTPYPSIGYLARSLRPRPVTQRDLGLELVLRVFSRDGLRAIFDSLGEDLPEPAWRALALRDQHEGCIDAVIRFLQGHDRGLGPRILDTPWLPRTPRLAAPDLDGFGPFAVDDAARRLATLYLADLADLVTSCVDEGFALARYHHHLAASARSYDPIAERLGRTTLIDAWLDTLADTVEADLVGLSVPFPGNLYGALRIGRRLRARGVFVLMGGGYVNTELRETDEPRLWECVDALTFDDGEGPLAAWIGHLEGGEDQRHRTRTRDGSIDRPHPDTAAAIAPDYGDLPLRAYLQLVDSLNPAHRLWSDGRWNKVTVAHGCYWRRCSFCDITLDYIARYAPARGTALADVMEEQVAATGQSGFHLVDEAAPPRGVRDLALELLARRLPVSFWGNIRFEKAWTPDLARLCAAAGLVAVTGGLEVASDRLLAKMEKGVTIEQAARACHAFHAAGVRVHAYLMYGFPTETVQETVDALEVVRQLFAEGLLDSAFWHRFVLTRHSGMYGRDADYGFVAGTVGSFAHNDVPHADPTGADPDPFDEPLAAALTAWMRGRELDRPAHTWIGGPPTTVAPDRIERALDAPWPVGERLVWIGGRPLDDGHALHLHHADGVEVIRVSAAERRRLTALLDAARPGNPPVPRVDFPDTLRRAGLLSI